MCATGGQSPSSSSLNALRTAFDEGKGSSKVPDDGQSDSDSEEEGEMVTAVLPKEDAIKVRNALSVRSSAPQQRIIKIKLSRM